MNSDAEIYTFCKCPFTQIYKNLIHVHRVHSSEQRRALETPRFPVNSTANVDQAVTNRLCTRVWAFRGVELPLDKTHSRWKVFGVLPQDHHCRW